MFHWQIDESKKSKSVVKSTQCFVYFIADSYEHIKIGVAKDVERRAFDLNVAHALPLYLYATICCENSDCAYYLESWFHNKFFEHGLHGEWFDLEPVRRWIVENIYIGLNFNARIMRTFPLEVKRAGFYYCVSNKPEISCNILLQYGRLDDFINEIWKDKSTREWSGVLHRRFGHRIYTPYNYEDVDIRMKKDTECTNALMSFNESIV